MENRFRLRISRMFRSSFGSCRTRKVSDVAEKVVFSLENHNKFRCMEPSSMSPPKVRPLPSICKPRYPESHQTTQDTRRKVPACYPPFLLSATDFDGRKCPPASPISPLNLFSNREDFGLYEKKKSLARKKKNNKRVHVKCKNMSSNSTSFSSSSHESVTYSNNYGGCRWWFSSEDETETLYSSRTLSSDSTESLRQHSNFRRKYNTRRRRAKSCSCNVGVLPLEGRNKVKDSFAVVKSSDDPYNDFKASMVEMIVERQIFAAKDLEQLLQCFLSLNSHHHHRIIIEVFTKICKNLFSNWS
ncbi:transcription repressor OFP8-like [Gossypium arboreum]|uniref:transcription repressor OFP8-like n=1 Tax=Gossypium arboreum TaxID=29729 RepID=UPI0008197495|nr:transcription repressor OFP8-like [Gossypium arboreum]